MKNALIVILVGIGLFFGSCGVKSAKLGNIKPDDIEYIKDCRTNLCYAIVGVVKGGDFTGVAESMGMACVPCDSLKNVKVKSNCK